MPGIKRICLFGTSANPPTGCGGHAGIVRFLASMTSCNTDDIHDTSLLFNEVRVLPVYKHMFHVSFYPFLLLFFISTFKSMKFDLFPKDPFCMRFWCLFLCISV
jgi:hypothetical protein